jgi:hypothetical protein
LSGTIRLTIILHCGAAALAKEWAALGELSERLVQLRRENRAAYAAIEAAARDLNIKLADTAYDLFDFREKPQRG